MAASLIFISNTPLLHHSITPDEILSGDGKFDLSLHELEYLLPLPCHAKILF
jgi:hypothetical protein